MLAHGLRQSGPQLIGRVLAGSDQWSSVTSLNSFSTMASFFRLHTSTGEESTTVIAPAHLGALFQESYSYIKDHSEGIGHADSIQTPPWGGDCLHWTVGHIVVARCNFLILLDVPSIWDWATCALFVPGSSPTVEASNHIDFTSLCSDLARTQDYLLGAVARLGASELAVVKDGRTIGEHLASYATHESYHAGQLKIIRRGLGK